jgi:hypothetical protein
LIFCAFKLYAIHDSRLEAPLKALLKAPTFGASGTYFWCFRHLLLVLKASTFGCLSGLSGIIAMLFHKDNSEVVTVNPRHPSRNTFVAIFAPSERRSKNGRP